MTEALRQRIYSLCSAYRQARLDFVLNFIADDREIQINANDT
jgi:hypothetical protein